MIDFLDKYKKPMEDFLLNFFSGENYIDRKILYHLGFLDEKGNPEKEYKTGKMIRPGLLLLTLDMLGSDWKSFLPAACAIETFHNSTLIIDDWQDDDQTRRGRKTLWTIKDIGARQAVNLGFFLNTQSSIMLSKLPSGVSEKIKFFCLEVFEEAKLRVIKGQYMDIAFEDKTKINLDQYYEMISLKTSSLIKSAIKTGAVLGGIKKTDLKYFSDFAETMGLIFQMRDDYLGTFGKTKETGKSLNDIKQRKKTLPVILAFAKAKDKNGKILNRIYTKKKFDKKDLSVIKKILDDLDIKDEILTLIDIKYQEFVGKINKIPESILKEKQFFIDIASFFALRNI